MSTDIDLLAAAVESKLLADGGQRRGDEIVFRCPTPEHPDKHPSASYNTQKQVWTCRGCPASGGLRAGDRPLVRLLDIDPVDYRDNGNRPMQRPPQRQWESRNAEGRLLGIHRRLDLPDGKKRTWWEGPNSAKKLGIPIVDLPLYAHDRLREREPGDDMPTIVCEGEPATDALLEHDIPALGTVTGANGTPGAKTLEILRGRDVVLWADNDETGKKHMARIAAKLVGVADRVRIFAPDDIPPKGDSVEWIAKHGDDDPVGSLLEAIEIDATDIDAVEIDATTVTGPQQLSDDVLEELRSLEAPANLRSAASLLGKLAQSLLGLSLLERETARQEAIRILSDKGVRAAGRLVDAALADGRGVASDGGERKTLVLEDVEPWPETVEGRTLLVELAAYFERSVSFVNASALTAVLLWVIHTHLRAKLKISPRLSLRSAVPGCGKTVLLDLIEPLVPRPVLASNLSAAVFYRVIEKYQPTLLIDEADESLRPDRNPELVQVVNAGHRVGGSVWRCVGEENEPTPFNVFGPVCYAGIGRFGSAAGRSREINVTMTRPAPGLLRKLGRPTSTDRSEEAHELHRRIRRWAMDHEEEFASADPRVPDELTGRAADNWRHLLAIADLVGGDWPTRGQEAALLLSGKEGSIDESDVKIQLLGDFRAIFDKRGDRVFTRDIQKDLKDMENRPWPEYGRSQKPITDRGIAKLLEDFDMRSGSLRIDGENLKGYERQKFVALFDSYLPPEDGEGDRQRPEGGFLSVTPSQVNKDGVCWIFHPSHRTPL